VGRSALRAIARHPELELAGVYVTSAAKKGVDAGDLCGLTRIGVAATDDVEEILALDAHCVCHTPLPSARCGDDPDADVRTICRLLESGKNVVTTTGFVYPSAYGPELVARLESACAKGGTSLHGTGVNPGFVGELLPLTLSSLSARIDRVRVLESSDFSRYPSREVIFGMMGFGRAPEEFEKSAGRYRTWLEGLFRESVQMIADGLARPLERHETRAEVRLARESFRIAAGEIARGSVAAQRFVFSGVAGGKPVIELEAVYRARADEAPDWAAPGCAVEIDGRPRMRVDLSEDWLANGLLGTAMHAVHAIPHVVRAAPGIRTFLDLPLITGRHTVVSA
jgi:4-hydroxy-tetrahydrodipicolinate reductase